MNDKIKNIDINYIVNTKHVLIMSSIENALNNNIDIDARDNKTKDTLLMYASSIGSLKLCKFLISRNASINLENNKGETPLLIATK